MDYKVNYIAQWSSLCVCVHVSVCLSQSEFKQVMVESDGRLKQKQDYW